MSTMSDQQKPSMKAPSSIPIPKSKRGLKGFWQDTLAEMKKVHWPTRPETNRLTGTVILVCVTLVALLYGLSVAADQILRIILRR